MRYVITWESMLDNKRYIKTVGFKNTAELISAKYKNHVTKSNVEFLILSEFNRRFPSVEGFIDVSD